MAADLWSAAQSGDARAVADLLQDGADPNDREGKSLSPLHWAVWKGHVDIVQLLLQVIPSQPRNSAPSSLKPANRRCWAVAGHWLPQSPTIFASRPS